MHELNLKGLQFPLITKDVKKFERQNPTISVNILQWTENQALPLQVTEYRDRPHHVNLLLLHDNKTSKSHYTLVRDLSILVAGRTKTHAKACVCPYCLYCFTYQNLLKNHIPECSIHPVQKITFPEPKDNEDVAFDIFVSKTFVVHYLFLLHFIATLNLFSFLLKMMIQHLIQRLVSSINQVVLHVFVLRKCPSTMEDSLPIQVIISWQSFMNTSKIKSLTSKKLYLKSYLWNNFLPKSWLDMLRPSNAHNAIRSIEKRMGK